MALTTLAAVKAFLNYTTTANDNWLTALMEAADAEIKLYCQQNFEEQEWTQYLSGNSTRVLVLKERPVTAVSHAYIDFDGFYGQNPGSFATELVVGTDFAIRFDGTMPDGTTPCSYVGVLDRIKTVWPAVDRQYIPMKLAPELNVAQGNVKVVYTAGFPVIPSDLQYAVAILCRYMMMTGKLGGMPLLKERIGDYSYEIGSLYRYLNLPELGSLRAILSRYRDPAM